MSENEKTIPTIERLKQGNERFVSDVLKNDDKNNIQKVRYLAFNGQDPHAVLVTCSDARISPERIFQAEMGDFFIIRTAGNVVGDVELASIEYAVSKVGADTIIVMGHENCGAIHSAVDHKLDDDSVGNIKHILKRVEPSVHAARQESDNYHVVIEKAENYNILNAIEVIKSSPVISQYIDYGKVTLTGAKYGISTGKVVFFNTLEELNSQI